MPSDRELKRIQRLAKKQKRVSAASEASDAGGEIENVQLNQSEDRNSPVSCGSTGMSSTDFDVESIADISEDNQENKTEAVEMDGTESELLVESMIETTQDDTNNQTDGSSMSTRVDDDNWSISDDTDSVDMKLVWLENHNCKISPGPNTLTLSGQVCSSL